MGKIIFLPMEGNHEFLKTQIHSTFCKFGADQFGQMDGDFRNGFDLSYIQRNNAKHNYQQRWGAQSPPREPCKCARTNTAARALPRAKPTPSSINWEKASF
jgi:hypothetical protein